MTNIPHLNGAVDLSKLAPAPSAGNSAAAGASYALALDEENLNDFIQRSTEVPVFLAVWSQAVPESLQVRDRLVAAVNAAAGHTLVGTVDAGAQPRIVQALRVSSAPFVAVALGGQLQPLYQQNLPAEQVTELVGQVVDGAAQQGVGGTVEPISTTEDTAEPETPERQLTPVQQAAQDLFDAGRYRDAVAAWKNVVDQSPADELAARELRRAALMERATALDAAAVRTAAADPSDVPAQLQAADLDFVAGNLPQAFNRLLGAFQAAVGDDRDPIRTRLVDLFAIAGDDPAVTQARGRLAALLF